MVISPDLKLRSSSLKSPESISKHLPDVTLNGLTGLTLVWQKRVRGSVYYLSRNAFFPHPPALLSPARLPAAHPTPAAAATAAAPPGAQTSAVLSRSLSRSLLFTSISKSYTLKKSFFQSTLSFCAYYVF